MNKRKYKITLLKKHTKSLEGDWFKVQIWNEYGHYHCVYERNVLDASNYIMDWWNQADELKKSKDLLSKAILNCKEIDSKNPNLREI